MMRDGDATTTNVLIQYYFAALQKVTTSSGSFTPDVLLFLTAADGLPRLSNCSYQAVLNHLELTRENELYSMTRPVQDHNQTTWVNLEVVLYAILDVVSNNIHLDVPVLLYKLHLQLKKTYIQM